MNHYSLISIEHINQLIPALAAIKHRQAGLVNHDINVLIFIKPHIRLTEMNKKHVQSLIKSFGNCQLIEGADLFKNNRFVHQLPVRLRSRFLAKKIGQFKVTDFYFAHDISGDFWNQTLMHCFPTARRLCFGDALGLVYSREYINSHMFSFEPYARTLILNSLSRIKRHWMLPRKKRQLFAQQALLALPCDPGNDVLKQCELSIIDQQTLKHSVELMANSIPDYKAYSIEKSSEDSGCTLLLLSNFTESKLTTLENEILLYKSILNTHVDKGSRVVVKPHPACNHLIFNSIKQNLQQDYCIEVMDDNYRVLPIELAETLIRTCRILSVSYSSISIPFIYDKPVKHVLTNELIHRYFNKDRIKWLLESNTLYIHLAATLPDWDKKSVLAAG